jgi:hypothetical protein
MPEPNKLSELIRTKIAAGDPEPVWLLAWQNEQIIDRLDAIRALLAIPFVVEGADEDDRRKAIEQGLCISVADLVNMIREKYMGLS